LFLTLTQKCKLVIFSVQKDEMPKTKGGVVKKSSEEF